MSDIIHLLPDSVANQIAAGEVIQRPASIIKELVENSLDAGATHIRVMVEDAGKSLVQVIDNGCGMSATDARLSFERHATSKIQQATDLFALRTMGFRGEALASIAAVAQVELRTRMASEELGTCIRIEGSRVVEQEATGCPVGANFAVRNLFFNIPARRKFLKSNQTELTNILTELERVALAHPEVAFTLHSGSNLMLDLPAGNFRQRIVGLFGKKTDSRLVPVEVETTLVKIFGFVGMPAASKRKNAHQYLFANGRFMRHPYFAKAIQTAYERLIPEGQQVPFFLHFQVDPARLDVNIHPTKTEIKFEDDNAIFQILLAAVREALGKYGAVPAIDFDVEDKPDIPTFGEALHHSPTSPAPPKIHINPSFNPFAASTSEEWKGLQQQQPEYFEAPQSKRQAPSHWQELYEQAKQAPLLDSGTNNFSPDIPQEEGEKQALYRHLSDAQRQEWENCAQPKDFLQFQGQFIVTPLNSGLALIDQHKAHIRILYEQYMEQLENRQAPSQRLLFPEMLNVSPSENSVLESLLPQLHSVGFDISPLGTGSFSILATPTGTEGIAPSALVGTILHDAITGEADAAHTVGHIVAFALARKVAMPVGQALSAEEMARIVEQLFTCATPNLTPDGSPTLIVIKPGKMF